MRRKAIAAACCDKAMDRIIWVNKSEHPMQAAWPSNFRGWTLKEFPKYELSHCPFCGILFKPLNKTPKDSGVAMEDIESMMNLRDKHADVAAPPSDRSFKASEVIGWAFSVMKSKALAGNPILTKEALIEIFDEEYQGE